MPGRRGILRRGFEWLLDGAQRRGSRWWLFAFAVLESCFLPFPLLLLLLMLCMGARENAFKFALICAAGSVVGGTLAYLLGYHAWSVVADIFIPTFVSPATFERAQQLYASNAGLVLLTSTVTPLSYKVCSLAAGVFHVDFATFLAVSVVGRPIRFLALAAVAYRFGDRAREIIERHFALVSWSLLLLVVTVYSLMRLLS
jgi:membrane protein YqaA with SNARE-associated domain